MARSFNKPVIIFMLSDYEGTIYPIYVNRLQTFDKIFFLKSNFWYKSCFIRSFLNYTKGDAMSINSVDYSYTYPARHYYLSTNKPIEKNANPTQTVNSDGDTFARATDTAKSLKSSGKLSAASLFGFEPKKSGCISIEELAAHVNERLAGFSEQLTKLLSEQGVDTSIPFSLGSEYGTGDVVVTSDHPDKEKIENFFSNNSDLQNEFTFINSRLAMVEEFKEAEKFHAAYRQNPVKAIEQYSYLFKTHIESIIEISNESSSAHYERRFNL